MSYKVGFVSLGCPKNLTDTETMAGILKDEYEIVNDASRADIIIVNTCAFIEDAKRESIDAILEMAEYKKKGLKYLVVTGCLAQRYADAFDGELPEVDAVVGTGSYYDIDKVIKALFLGKKIKMLGDINAGVPEGLPRQVTTPAFYAYLKISDGCDNRCTYCVIPSLRGRYRSRRIEDIISEARGLIENGAKELVLIAQDTTRYGADIYGKPVLHKLVSALNGLEGAAWIRLLYCYPELITDELIEAISKSPRICEYLDIPLQHISGRILHLMGRRSTPETIRSLFKRLRDAVPGITIRSTLITGFPGETDEDFNELLEFVKEGNFDRLGVFTYSEEEGTPAAGFPDKVDEKVKRARQRALMDAQRQVSLSKNMKKQGDIIDVLCEGADSQSGLYFGRSRGDAPGIDGKVYFSGQGVAPGDIVKVRVTGCTEYDISGELARFESCK